MKPAPFEIASTPLEPGVTLLEASAGTGKTFAITAIFLRLLLEGRVDDLRRILVVTFTKDATAELRARLRDGLQRGARVLAGHGSADDHRKLPYLEQLRERHPEGGAILAQALRQFDELSVFTIHGFCRRVLERQAFESGLPFRVQFVQDDQDFLMRAAADFWRRRVVTGGMDLAVCLHRNKVHPKTLLERYREFSRLSRPRTVPTPLEWDDALDQLRDASATLRDRGDALWELMEQVEFKKKGPWEHLPDGKEMALVGLRRWLDGDDRALWAALDFGLAQPNRTRSKKHLDRAEFGELGALKTAAANVCRSVEHTFYLEVREDFRREKERLGTLDLNDLLHLVRRNLLDANHGAGFCAAIRNQWQVALVDEFQDTDPTQWDIFREVFAEPGLFMIGDPKQAIYSFRGADVFAYLRARDVAARRYTLTHNWRSHPDLIATLNRVWGRLGDPFLHRDIGYHPVEAGRVDLPTLTTGDGDHPVHLWLAESANAAGLDDCLRQAIAAECRKLLDRGRFTGSEDRRVRPDDLAILVRANREAPPLQQALTRAGIPSVIARSGDVLDADEALELGILLLALAIPGRPQLVRAALGTALLGHTAAELADDDEAMWSANTHHLDQCRSQWAQAGATAALQGLLRDVGTRARYLATPDGPRRLTNLDQLLELIHQRAQQGDDNPDAIAHWFQRLRRQRPLDDEVTEMRPETDADAVRIVTIHRAKGLEYPIVFAPFLGRGSKPLKTPFAVHSDDGGDGVSGVVFETGGDRHDEHRALRTLEDHGEDMRLAYVALTRAIYRVYTFLPQLKTSEQSAPAWLWLGPGDADSGEAPNPAAPHSPSPDPAAHGRARQAIKQQLANLAPEAIGVEGVAVRTLDDESGLDRPPATSAPADTTLPPRRLATHRPAPVVPRGWSVASFTGITSGLGLGPGATPTRTITEPDDDAATTRTRPGHGFLGFARGSGPGTCLHAILERVDLSQPDAPHTAATVHALLRLHGFDRPAIHPNCADPEAAVLEMLGTLAASPWPEPAGGGAWAQTTPDRRLDEWSFHLPLGALRPRSLARLFQTHGDSVDQAYAPHLQRLGHVPIDGFLTGSVDAVIERDGRYYVVDWKSNHLGPERSDYSHDALTEAMHGHHYLLQGHLYYAALRRYLIQRLAPTATSAAAAADPAAADLVDQHLGGILYVFLRGLDGAGGGQWFHRPSSALTVALDGALAGDLSRSTNTPRGSRP